jgi:dTDP-4-dehydrorhamnose reductase
MKIVVLGSKGQLGCCLSDQFIKTTFEVVYLSRDDFDIGDLASLDKNISLLKPSIVINASAYTAVDKAENDFHQANLVNHLAVAKLADICLHLNACLIHISTDYVFDGNAVLPYVEDSQTNPQGVYGMSKLKGELSIKASGCRFFIIRTSWVFSEYGNNFLKTMLKLGTKHKELSIIHDQVGCPTYAQDIAKAIILMLPYIRNNKYTSGIFHYCGIQSCSWYEFAAFIFMKAEAKGYKVPSLLKQIASDEFKSIAARPAYSVLDCSRIQEEFDINPSNWMNGVISSIEKIDSNAILNKISTI